MENLFEITRCSRNMLLKFLDGYTPEQLNKVPAGFSNNLIWNIAHIVVVEQMLVHNLSGLPMLATAEMVNKYKRGTKPESDAGQAEIDEIRSLLLVTIEKTQEDFNNGVFENYNEFTTMSGFTVKSAADAIAFNIYHEATHTGIMMSIRKFI